MNVRYIVELTPEERDQLKTLTVGGVSQVRRIKRAQILLAADGGSSDEEIARTVGVGTSTVYRTKRRLVEGGVEHALAEQPRPGGHRKLSTNEEAMLVALACASPPHTYVDYANRPGADLDLILSLHPSGQVVDGSTSYDNTFEIIEYTPSTSSYYIARVNKGRCDASPKAVGFAYWVDP
jgi:hypothetical protein